MPDYSKSAASALAMIIKFGQSVTRKASSVGTYSAGVYTTAPASTTRKGVVIPFNEGQTTVQGSLIQSGDVRLFLDAEGPVLLTDHYVIGTAEYSTVSIETLSPAGTVVLNTLHLRLI